MSEQSTAPLEVLEAAGSKWNFLPFRPGLVGGHCIGVDPSPDTQGAGSRLLDHPVIPLSVIARSAGIHAFGKSGHVLYDVKSISSKAEADGRL